MIVGKLEYFHAEYDGYPESAAWHRGRCSIYTNLPAFEQACIEAEDAMRHGEGVACRWSVTGLHDAHVQELSGAFFAKFNTDCIPF